MALEAAKRDAAKGAQAQIKALQARQEALVAQRVKAAREATEKRLAEIVAAEKTKASEDRIKLTEQLADLKRRLEHKTADELGSGAEVDLYKALHKEFGGDGQGNPGTTWTVWRRHYPRCLRGWSRDREDCLRQQGTRAMAVPIRKQAQAGHD